MNKDTIYREDAIKALHDEIVRRRISEDSNDDGALDEFDTEAILRQLPPAQPEIVRCKDCKYWREHKYAKKTKRYIPRYIPFCGFNAIYTKSDDFCSRAERSEE